MNEDNLPRNTRAADQDWSTYVIVILSTELLKYLARVRRGHLLFNSSIRSTSLSPFPIKRIVWKCSCSPGLEDKGHVTAMTSSQNDAAPRIAQQKSGRGWYPSTHRLHYLAQGAQSWLEMDNADLEKLKISPGKLIPRFKASVTEYSVTLASSVEEIKFSPLTSDSGASYTVKVHTTTVSERLYNRSQFNIILN